MQDTSEAATAETLSVAPPPNVTPPAAATPANSTSQSLCTDSTHAMMSIDSHGAVIAASQPAGEAQQQQPEQPAISVAAAAEVQPSAKPVCKYSPCFRKSPRHMAEFAHSIEMDAAPSTIVPDPLPTAAAAPTHDPSAAPSATSSQQRASELYGGVDATMTSIPSAAAVPMSSLSRLASPPLPSATAPATDAAAQRRLIIDDEDVIELDRSQLSSDAAAASQHAASSSTAAARTQLQSARKGKHQQSTAAQMGRRTAAAAASVPPESAVHLQFSQAAMQMRTTIRRKKKRRQRRCRRQPSANSNQRDRIKCTPLHCSNSST